MKYSSVAVATLVAFGADARQEQVQVGSRMPSRVTTQVVAPDMFIGEVSGFMLSSQGKNSSTTDSFDYDEERSNHQGSTNTSLLLSGLFAVFMMMSYPTSKIPSHVAEDDANDDAKVGQSDVDSNKNSQVGATTSMTNNVSAFEDNGNEVLHNTFKSLMDQFCTSGNSSVQSPPVNNNKAVEFLSPKELVNKLFDPSSSNEEDGACSLSLVNQTTNNISPQQMMKLFGQIQRYSVNTSHPFFFNQLFGALDPVALAAEMVALSVHTSPYTWETAPVMTMIEREVMTRLGKLVFEGDHGKKEGAEGAHEHTPEASYNELLNNKYDGLMMPGGSLSNLTSIHLARHFCLYGNKPAPSNSKKESRQPKLVAFVSKEAHYSFKKAASVTGIGSENMIAVPTLLNGQMDVEKLDSLLAEFHDANGDSLPFYVAATAGSTVRGSFDDIDAIIRVCRKHENIMSEVKGRRCKIWVHVDGAWGGSTIFSARSDMKHLMNGVHDADSFTFNPHKFLGAPQQTTAFVTRHKGILKTVNSCESKYLFDPRKNGAEFDLGDGTYTCGRKSDAIKLWAQWKYYGSEGIGSMVEKKVDSLQLFTQMIRENDSLMFACNPWPLNVNFFYLPDRLRRKLKERGVDMASENPVIPDDISEELAEVSVNLKLKLHQSGEMILPYQPLSNQKADCFRLVLAGNKTFEKSDYERVLQLLEEYGKDL